MFTIFKAVTAAAVCALASASAQTLDAETLEETGLTPEEIKEGPFEVGEEGLPTLSDEPTETIDPFARDTFRLRPVVCPFGGRVDYDKELTSCQMLQVPENRSADETRMIELLVTTVKAEEPEDWDADEKGAWEKRPDPMIYLDGGPGGPGYTRTERFRFIADRTMRDLIILDQRGVGYSGDFCPHFGGADPEATNVATFEAYGDAQLMLNRVCLKNAAAAGVDLTGYSNPDNALDVVALRKALELESWNIWGISYGSTLALELLRIDPDGIRSSIIDGIAPVDYPDDFAAYGKIFTRALTQLQMACNDDEACRDEFPDMAGDVRAAMSTVREAPVVIEDAIDPEAFPSGSATFFHDSIGGLAFISLYGSRTYPNLPAMIAAAKAAAEEGSLDERMRFLTGMSGDVFGDFAEGMSIAVTCQLGWNDNAADARAADVAAYPELSGIVSTDVLNKTPELCREFGLLARETTPLDTDVPTFIANGQIDPITPPEFAEYILPGFSQAQYIEVPYAGHGPTADDETCMSDVMRAFLDAPTDELDMTCLEEEIEAPAFVGPMWRTQGVTNVLADSFDEGKKGLLLGGLGAISTLGFVVLTLGGLARVANPSDYSVGADMGGGRTLTWLATALVAGGLGTVAYGAYSLSETLPFALIFGLPGYTRWGAVALVVAALPALLALFQLVRHLFAPRLPVGTFFGTLILNVAVVGVVAMAIMVGFAPWAG